MHTFQAINWYPLSKSPKSIHRSNNKLVLVCINNWVFAPLGSERAEQCYRYEVNNEEFTRVYQYMVGLGDPDYRSIFW
jgi:hypothetical protein